MKKFFSFVFLFAIVGIVYLYRNDITKYIVYNYIYKKEIEVPASNEYKRNYDFDFVKNTTNFYPNNKQELYNVFYTILNNGYEEFTFYCGKKYTSCSDDVRDITSSKNQILSTINNYVHPYNSYNSISININNLGRIQVHVNKLYKQSDIELIDKEVNRIYNALITPTMTDREKIRVLHDYVVNHTTYDKTWVSEKNKTSKANTAYGPLYNKVALCGGYTDLMQLFLEKMKIKSYKIATNNHIWNYIYVENSWKHLDTTWDDPVTNTGRNLLKYDYFLITTKQLEFKNDKERVYDKNYYIEAQ